MGELTTSVTVAEHVLQAVQAQASLKALRPRHVGMRLVNSSNIDGKGPTRKITKRAKLAEAEDSPAEGVSFDNFKAFGHGTSVELAPVQKIQGIAPTVKSLRNLLPGATYEQVKRAIREGNPALLPALVEMYAEILSSHFDALERATLATYVAASESAGSTNTVLSFATFIDGKTKILDNDIDNTALVAVISQRGFAHLQQEILSPSSGLAAMWGDGMAEAFIQALGAAGVEPAIPATNSVAGIPIYVASASLMSKANSDVDQVGAIHAYGSGLAEMGLRGHAEICEGHAPSMSLELDNSADVGKAIGRYEWDVEEHTDEHICKLIYRAS
jgi:hypothetical protein